MSSYLKKHEYANAKQDDLWAALTDVAHNQNSLPRDMTVKEIMDTWTLQVGYPMIQIDRNYEENSAELSQMRFLSDRYKTRDDTEQCWWIPLTYSDSEKNDFNTSHVSLEMFLDFFSLIKYYPPGKRLDDMWKRQIRSEENRKSPRQEPLGHL